MRAVIQRVANASVSAEGEVLGRIDQGLLIFLGVGKDDTQDDMTWLADKIMKLRIFSDQTDKMNLSVADVSGKILIISQFTLYANCKKGMRPGFDRAGNADEAEKMYEQFCAYCKANKMHVETGKFGADMKVALLNDGPVTIILDTKNRDLF